MCKETINLDLFGEIEFETFHFYDKPRGMISKDGEILAIWYDDTYTGEIWIVIKTNREIADKFINTGMSLYELLEINSKIFLYRRYYKTPDKFSLIEKIIKSKINIYNDIFSDIIRRNIQEGC